MSAAPTTYRKLPGGGVSLATTYRLYEGPDHLLQVCSTGYSESYKRFYYRDVQAVIVQRNRMWQLWGWIWGGNFALWLGGWLIGLATMPAVEMGYVVVVGVLLALASVPVLANWLMGPTCSCHLRTAVQLEKLPSLGRLRKAEQLVARFKSLIEAAQGPLSPEALQASTVPSAVQEAPPVMASAPVAALPASAPPPIKHYDGRMHLVLCWLLLADLPSTAMDYLNSPGTDVLGVILIGATTTVAIIAGVKQMRTDLPDKIKRLPWVVLGMFGVLIVASIAYGIVLVVEQGPSRLEGLRVWDDPILLTMTIVSTGFTVVLGVLGLVWLRTWRATAAPPGPPPMQEEPPAAA
ncbi:MAG: hypothetical protein HZA90_20130 [Verrucomicrobia bacterium]|nr:hypothetical protein [Verrucomicrobiota bacterium]